MDSFSRKRLRPEDWEEIEPSKVVHVRELCEHTLEIDVARALERFGPIRDIAMMPKKRQALVEFEELEYAREAVEAFRNDVLYIADKPCKINYSTSVHVVKRTGPKLESVSSANKVLIFFIYEAVYPITVEVITKICKPHGRLVRIFINRKAPVLQALVEFYSVEDAIRVKRNLNGADIYSGCCTLKIEFATTNRVNVHTNTEDSWDFESNVDSRSARQSLLGFPSEPRGMGHQIDNLNDMGRRNMQSSFENDGYDMPSYEDRPNRMFRGPTNPSGYDEISGRNNGDMMDGPRVAMVYGINVQTVNCDVLFNLLCIYGNVMKVKFLKSKEGSAMVEMGDEGSLNRMMSLLHNQDFFGKTLQFQISKQQGLMDVPVPYKLPDGSPSYKNFSECRENRFMNPESAQKNRVFPPSITVNYWNAPPHYGFDSIKEEFTKLDAVVPTEFYQLTDREKSSSGLLQFSTTEEALNSIALCNHMLIDSEGSKFPYQLKMSFSESPIRHGSGNLKVENRTFKGQGRLGLRGRGRGISRGSI